MFVKYNNSFYILFFIIRSELIYIVLVTFADIIFVTFVDTLSMALIKLHYTQLLDYQQWFLNAYIMPYHYSIFDSITCCTIEFTFTVK